jgi:hypothetical protein
MASKNNGFWTAKALSPMGIIAAITITSIFMLALAPRKAP